MQHIHIHCNKFLILYVESPDVLLWVQGRATSPHLRTMIRESIGSVRMWPDNLKVMTVFFMGTLPAKYANTGYQLHIDYEYEAYRDIVQTSFKGETLHTCIRVATMLVVAMLHINLRVSAIY